MKIAVEFAGEPPTADHPRNASNCQITPRHTHVQEQKSPSDDSKSNSS
jgi:hypothetical protein